MTFAERVRKFLRDLFGSRLVLHLETELLSQQSQYETRLNERDQLISDLRSEVRDLKSKQEQLELDPSYFWYLANRSQSRRPAPPSADPILDTSVSEWQRIQNEHYAREEAEALKEHSNGVSNGGREVQEQQV